MEHISECKDSLFIDSVTVLFPIYPGIIESMLDEFGFHSVGSRPI